MKLTKSDIRDALIKTLDEDLEEVNNGDISVDFMRGEINGVVFMLHLLNLYDIGESLEYRYVSRLYELIKDGRD